MEKIKDVLTDCAIWMLFPLMLLCMELVYRFGDLEDFN